MKIEIDPQEIVKFILDKEIHRCFICGCHGGGRLATKTAHLDTDHVFYDWEYKRHLCDTCSFDDWLDKLSDDLQKEIIEVNNLNSLTAAKYEDLPYANFARQINEIFNREIKFRNLLK